MFSKKYNNGDKDNYKLITIIIVRNVFSLLIKKISTDYRVWDKVNCIIQVKKVR